MNEESNKEEDRIYNILIVDDEKEVLNALSTTLKRAKQFKSDIVTAENPERALDFLKERDFDLVLSDYKMPGINGVDFLKEVKNNHPDTVRMLITGFSDLKTAREAINLAEVNNYLEKPWDNEELRSVVHAALKRKNEREDVGDNQYESVSDALVKVRDFQEDLRHMDPGNVIDKKPKMMCAFNSIRDFNKFSFEIKKMGNVNIEDVYIFENRYLISLAIYPQSFKRIR
jgi:YesN/AraC family two-component response regulator